MSPTLASSVTSHEQSHFSSMLTTVTLNVRPSNIFIDPLSPTFLCETQCAAERTSHFPSALWGPLTVAVHEYGSKLIFPSAFGGSSLPPVAGGAFGSTGAGGATGGSGFRNSTL